MDTIVRVTCPACGKLVRLCHVTAGVMRVSFVKGLADDGKHVSPITSGGFDAGGIFSGYRCQKCSAILAIDSKGAVELVEHAGFVSRDTEFQYAPEGKLLGAESEDKYEHGIIFIREKHGVSHLLVPKAMIATIQPLIGKRIRAKDGEVFEVAPKRKVRRK